MHNRYFGQHGDDFLLWQLFKDQKNGFYIDVGAFDGVHLSNTYSFELAGWNGICVEAIPDIFESCQKARPNTICINAACIGRDDLREVKFFVEKLGLLSGVSVDANEDDIRNRYSRRGIDFEGLEPITVPARTLNSILDDHLAPGHAIDFVSIDVEGSELDVLKGFDLNRYAPRCIVIEANDDEHERAIMKCLVEKEKYIFARRLGANLFFAHDNKDANILRNTEVRCQIEPTVHPLGKEYTLSDHVGGKAITPDSGLIKRCKHRILGCFKYFVNVLR